MKAEHKLQLVTKPGHGQSVWISRQEAYDEAGQMRVTPDGLPEAFDHNRPMDHGENNQLTDKYIKNKYNLFKV